MGRRRAQILVLIVAVGLVSSAAPAFAAPPAASPRVPNVSIVWNFGTPSPFAGTRFDGAYVAFQKRVYFLGFRTLNDETDGSIWYYDVLTDTYVDTGVDMPVPVSNYQIAQIKDEVGLGLFIFGGRTATAELVDTVQVYYPASGTASIVSSDPWPGRTPSGCISLPAMGVATVNNKAVVMGGASFSANGCIDDNSAETWIYTPRATAGSRWSRGPDLNMARGYITPGVVGKTIYAIGGDVNVAGTLTPQQIVESWDAPNGTWDDAGVADLPIACDESQAFGFTDGPLANGVELAGCGQWPNALADTYFYDGSANTWSYAGALNEIRRNQAGTFVDVGDGQILMAVVGGYGSDGFTPITSSEVASDQSVGAGRPGFARPAPSTGGSPSTT
jgi:hypothetical protein